jgi:16S rRNA (cytosine967-C5)-methyltransferase
LGFLHFQVGRPQPHIANIWNIHRGKQEQYEYNRQDYKLTEARSVALAVLGSVAGGNALDAAFEALEAKHFAGMDARDRAFARLMVLTTLRRRGQIDDAVAKCLDRPLGAKYRKEREILRLGAAQILFLHTKAHGAVDGTVALAGRSPLRGLINAVLRRLTREGAAIVEAQDSDRISTPNWLQGQWDSQFGETNARAIAAAHLAQPPLDVTVKTDPKTWAERLSGFVTPLGSVRIADAGPIPDLAGFADGAWWVQDAAATIPANLLLAAVEPPAGARIADLCAAPGGKTAQLCVSGAAVTAVDRSPLRLKRLRDNLARLGLSAQVITEDATEWKTPAPFAGVLLDAPCTATGTIRRRPDILWAKDAASAEKLTAVQDRLLRAAGGMVAPGGVLVYCTCSLDAREGVERIEAFLADHPDFSRAPIDPAEVGGLDDVLTDIGDLRTLPCHLGDIGGMDGFYAARLRRRR